jgi:hypothetical protein
VGFVPDKKRCSTSPERPCLPELIENKAWKI